MTTEPDELERDERAVFVVHGRHTAAREAMFDFLSSLGLQPLEWSFLVKLTRKGSPYVGEVLDAGFRVATAAVVLFTPDDEARLRDQFHSINEPTYEQSLTGQPRQNVILEAGMALGAAPDRTILIEFGTLRPISDITGRHVIRINNSEQRRRELAERLQTAGCPVDLSTDAWKTAGDFDRAILELEGHDATSTPEELAPGYVVETLTLHEIINGHDFELEYPHVVGLPDANRQRRVNVLLAQGFSYFAGLVDENGESRRLEYELEEGEPTSTELGFHVELTTSSLLSVYASMSYYCGGAHPAYGSLGYLIDLASGYRYHLHDLFRPDVNYLGVLRTLIRRDLERQFREDPYWDAAPPEPDEGTPRQFDFVLTERGLQILNLYSAHALHAVSVEIPLTDVEHIADPNGPIARLLAARRAIATRADGT